MNLKYTGTRNSQLHEFGDPTIFFSLNGSAYLQKGKAPKLT